MAQKKIGDLQLRTDFDATCNIPVADASQTWRTTGAQLLTYIRAQFIATASKSGNYTLTDAEEAVIFTATADATLPTAVGRSGKRFTIINSGTGITTLKTTSSQTIAGIASAVIKLATNLDTIEVVSDGANWLITVFNVKVTYEGDISGQTPKSLSSTTAFTVGSAVIDTQGGHGSGGYTVKIPGLYEAKALFDGAAAGAIGSSGGNALFRGELFHTPNGGAISGIGRYFDVRNQSTGTFNAWNVFPIAQKYCGIGDLLSVNCQTNFTTPGTGTAGRFYVTRIGG